ncbi:MAG: hypothetical protein V3S33_04640, partial [Gammaproteobacteria bacterium]
MLKHIRLVIFLIAGLAVGWYAHKYWSVSEYLQPAMQIAKDYNAGIEALGRKGHLSLGQIERRGKIFDDLLKYHQY